MDARIHIIGIAMTSFCCVAVLVNTILSIIFIRSRRKLQTYKLAFLNLAISDLIMATYGAVFKGRDFIEQSKDDVSCRIDPILSIFVVCLNFISVTPITIDRIVAVIFPIRYRKRRHRMMVIIAVIGCWVVSIAVTIIYILTAYICTGQVTVYNPATFQCWFSFSKASMQVIVLDWFVRIMFMIVPLIFNIAAYTTLIRVLTLKDRNETKEVVLKAILICTFFTVSWLPMFICLAILQIKSPVVIAGCIFVLYLNCLLDPVLYALSKRMTKSCLRKWTKSSTRVAVAVAASGINNSIIDLSVVQNGALHYMNRVARFSRTASEWTAKCNQGTGTAKCNQGTGTAKCNQGTGTAKCNQGTGTAKCNQGTGTAKCNQGTGTASCHGNRRDKYLVKEITSYHGNGSENNYSDKDVCYHGHIIQALS